MFLWLDSNKINNHLILLKSRSPSNYASLIVDISISEEFIQDKWQTIICNSEEEKKIVAKLTNIIGNIDTLNISSKEISLNIPKHGRMKNVIVNWTSTDFLKQLKTGRISRESLRKSKVYILTRFKKSYEKSKDLRTSWTGLKSVNCQL